MFYEPKSNPIDLFFSKKVRDGVCYLSTEESGHCAKVLRHQVGDRIGILDGMGNKYLASLVSVHPQKCIFKVEDIQVHSKKPYMIHLVVALPKRTERAEWLVEKLEELGVDEVTFIKTKYSEREKIRIERLNKKVIAAMKQSQNPFMLKINEVAEFSHMIKSISSTYEHKFIMLPNEKLALAKTTCKHKGVIILIGPEGGFSKEEISLAKSVGFVSASLGNNILRTETAGLLACSLIHFINIRS